MHASRCLPALLAGLAGLMVYANPAAANSICSRNCACPHYVRSAEWFAPEEMMPVNGRVLVIDPYEISPTVTLTRDSDGAAIPFGLEPVAGTAHMWVVPDSDLDANTHYTVEVDWDFVSGDGHRIPFWTSALRDETPPTLTLAPSDEGLELCESVVGTVATPTVTDADPISPIVMLTVRRRDAPDLHLFTFANWGSIVIGAGDGSVCPSEPGSVFAAETLPSAELGETIEIEMIAYDAAGHASHPVTFTRTLEPLAAADDIGPECGCSVAHGSTRASLAWLVAALALGLRLAKRSRMRA